MAILENWGDLKTEKFFVLAVFFSNNISKVSWGLNFPHWRFIVSQFLHIIVFALPLISPIEAHNFFWTKSCLLSPSSRSPDCGEGGRTGQAHLCWTQSVSLSLTSQTPRSRSQALAPCEGWRREPETSILIGQWLQILDSDWSDNRRFHLLCYVETLM